MPALGNRLNCCFSLPFIFSRYMLLCYVFFILYFLCAAISSYFIIFFSFPFFKRFAHKQTSTKGKRSSPKRCCTALIIKLLLLMHVVMLHRAAILLYRSVHWQTIKKCLEDFKHGLIVVK